MKYATRILVSVIAASKSQEFLLTVRRRFYIFISTTTQMIRPRRQVDVFSTTPYTTLTRSPITLAERTRQTAKNTSRHNVHASVAENEHLSSRDLRILTYDLDFRTRPR